MKFIVKQVDRWPRYEVEASGFIVKDETATFYGSNGVDLAAITDVEYIAPFSEEICEVTLFEEEK
jgi:hypothetical protein